MITVHFDIGLTWMVFSLCQFQNGILVSDLGCVFFYSSFLLSGVLVTTLRGWFWIHLHLNQQNMFSFFSHIQYETDDLNAARRFSLVFCGESITNTGHNNCNYHHLSLLPSWLYSLFHDVQGGSLSYRGGGWGCCFAGLLTTHKMLCAKPNITNPFS